MNILRKSTASEMILEWLKAELHSSRFSTELLKAISDLGADATIITNADLASDQQSQLRSTILNKYRPWFNIDASSYDWQLVELNQQEVGQLKYIDYDYWNELSAQTLRVDRAAENVKNGKEVFDVSNDNFHSIAKAFETGQSFPPIIIVAGEIIEGHLRVTSYALSDDPPSPLLAIIGTKV